MSGLITHFCDRARPQAVPADIRALSAPDRLASILWAAHLRAFVTFSGGDPAVCFTEATIPGLNFVIGSRGYQPWALVFHRQSVYDAGGAPVWYARPEEHGQLRDMGTPRMRAWSVRLEPGSSDWLEEREWRVPMRPTTDGSPTAVWIPPLELYAVIVGDATWTPVRTASFIDRTTGIEALGPALPGTLHGVQRWWWNPASRQLEVLEPLLPH